MFCDLNKAIITGEIPDVAIVAIGAFPIREEGGFITFNGVIFGYREAERLFTEALGLGAVLTFKNPKKKNLKDLGNMCLEYGHGWTLHTMTITVLFHDVPVAVRNAFAFDRRFHLSWVENEQRADRVTFTATGSLKEWKKIIARAEDPSFKAVQRLWFERAGNIIKPILPRYFKTLK